ncbi:MAG: hypothetical protein N3E52_02060 [Candidatus Bathyarchaeota archaeon]|nr:hypothetical protein [Candidatus Bathyarchaeota archaeon]
MLPAGLSILLLLAIVQPVTAQTRVVGVKVGDWFKYKVSVPYYESTGPFPPTYSPLSLADNETNWIMYNVTGITADVINFTVTYSWKNGTVTTTTYDENVTFSNILLAIGANMKQGDMVRDTFLFFGFYQWPALYLNQSITLNGREINTLRYSIDISGSVYNYTLYWDKATGMRVYYENSGDVLALDMFGQPAYKYTVKWELIESSISGLVIPDLTAPMLLTTIMLAAVPMAMLYRRKKKIPL